VCADSLVNSYPGLWWGDLSSAPGVQFDCLHTSFPVCVAWLIGGSFPPDG